MPSPYQTPQEPYVRLQLVVGPPPRQVGIAGAAKLVYLMFVGFPLCVMLMAAGVVCCMTIVLLPVGLALIATGVRVVRL